MTLSLIFNFHFLSRIKQCNQCNNAFSSDILDLFWCVVQISTTFFIFPQSVIKILNFIDLSPHYCRHHAKWCHYWRDCLLNTHYKTTVVSGLMLPCCDRSELLQINQKIELEQPQGAARTLHYIKIWLCILVIRKILSYITQNFYVCFCIK